MKKYVYLNGQYADAASAAVSVFDAGFLYGEGLFETFRSYNGRVFALEEHLNRMRASAGYFDMPFSLSSGKLQEIIKRLGELNSERNCVYRLILTRGYGMMWKGRKQMPPTVAVLSRDLHTDAEALKQSGAKVVVSGVPRDSSNPMLGHKTLNYLQNVLARSAALKKNAFDALFFDSKGRLLEGAISNVFIVKNRRIFTPALRLNILPGITRAVVMRLAKNLKFSVSEKEISRSDLMKADEVFLTNSVVGIMPVRQIGGHRVSGKVPGKLTYLLSEVYTIEVSRKLRLNNGNV